MYIVTGAAGFVGSAFIAKLNSHNITNVLAVDNLTNEKWKNLRKLKFKDIVTKEKFIKNLYKNKYDKIKAIIHMGACSSTTETDYQYLLDNNYYYSKKLCKFAINNHIKFINASSAATYGDGSLGFSDTLSSIKLIPLNMYGYTKNLFDIWLRRNGLLNNVSSLKFFNIFGPNEYHKGNMISLVYKSYSAFIEDQLFYLFKSNNSKYKDGCQERDFIYIKDVVEYMYIILNASRSYGILNIGTGKSRTIRDLIDSVILNTKKGLFDYKEMPDELKHQYQNYTKADISKLNSLIEYKCRSLEKSIKDYITNHLVCGDMYLNADNVTYGE